MSGDLRISRAKGDSSGSSSPCALGVQTIWDGVHERSSAAATSRMVKQRTCGQNNQQHEAIAHATVTEVSRDADRLDVAERCLEASIWVTKRVAGLFLSLIY